MACKIKFNKISGYDSASNYEVKYSTSNSADPQTSGTKFSSSKISLSGSVVSVDVSQLPDGKTPTSTNTSRTYYISVKAGNKKWSNWQQITVKCACGATEKPSINCTTSTVNLTVGQTDYKTSVTATGTSVEVTNSSSSICTATYSANGKKIKLVGKGGGTATITVKSTNCKGTTTKTFKVIVAEPQTTFSFASGGDKCENCL